MTSDECGPMSDPMLVDDTFVFGDNSEDQNAFLTHSGLYRSPLQTPSLDLEEFTDESELQESLQSFDLHLRQLQLAEIVTEETKPKPEARIAPTVRKRKQSLEGSPATKRRGKEKVKKQLYYERDSNLVIDKIEKKKIDKAKKSRAYRLLRNGDHAFYKFAFTYMVKLLKPMYPNIEVDVRDAFEAEKGRSECE